MTEGLSNRLFGLLIAGIIVSVVLMVTVQYTDALRLEEVLIDGQPLADWKQKHDMLDTGAVFSQPLDSLAAAILSGAGTYKVDVAVSLPHRLEVVTNDFYLICLLLDQPTGIMVGLDRQARVVPLQSRLDQWEKPVITGVEADRRFHRSELPTVTETVSQLVEIHDENLDLYRMIDEIDLSHKEYARLYLAGLPYTLKARVGFLHYDLQRFVEFVTRYDPALDGVREVDLRFPDMIVCCGSRS